MRAPIFRNACPSRGETLLVRYQQAFLKKRFHFGCIALGVAIKFPELG